MMKKLATFAMLLLLVACSSPKTKIPCFAWTGGPGNATDSQLKAEFSDLKKKGVDGLMYSAGRDPEVYKRVARIAKEAGLQFHAWIPTLTQNNNPDIKPEWFAINGIGESTYDKPTFGAGHYHFVCPNRPEVCDYLEQMYAKIADIPDVDGIHLDFIRFPDVILAKGLWKKYNLVMDKEYP